MNHCPLKFNHALVEGFQSGHSSSQMCPSSSSTSKDTHQSTLPVYQDKREENIEAISNQYSHDLREYLAAYNQYLLDPNDSNNMSKLQNQKHNLETLLGQLQRNNTDTQQKIHGQNDKIVDLQAQIQHRNQQLADNNKIISEQNDILYSREQQIKMGVQKNIYKRNLMYFLIFLNVIVIIVLIALVA